MTSFRAMVGFVPLLAVALAGCGATEEAAEPSTAADAEVPPLTREEIQEHAEAMTPAMAESLGIVDTTIRIESPMPAESVRTSPFLTDSAPAR
jgi:hypothetical protein